MNVEFWFLQLPCGVAVWAFVIGLIWLGIKGMLEK